LDATSNYKRCFGGMEKKVKEELCPRSLKVDAFGYLVVLGRRGIGGYLRARRGLFKISNFIS